MTDWQAAPTARAICRAWWTGTIESASPWIRSIGRRPQRRAERSGIRLSVRTPKASRAAIRMPGLNHLGQVAVQGELAVEQFGQVAERAVEHHRPDLGVLLRLHQQGRRPHRPAQPADPVGRIPLAVGPVEHRAQVAALAGPHRQPRPVARAVPPGVKQEHVIPLGVEVVADPGHLVPRPAHAVDQHDQPTLLRGRAVPAAQGQAVGGPGRPGQDVGADVVGVGRVGPVVRPGQDIGDHHRDDAIGEGDEDDQQRDRPSDQAGRPPGPGRSRLHAGPPGSGSRGKGGHRPGASGIKARSSATTRIDLPLAATSSRLQAAGMV